MFIINRYPGTMKGSFITIFWSLNNFLDHIVRKKKTGRKHVVTLWVHLKKEKGNQPIFAENISCKRIPQESLDCLWSVLKAQSQSLLRLVQNKESNCRASICILDHAN